MTTAVLLTTLQCNITCAHCSVDSHPKRHERMPLPAALAYLRGLAATPGIDYIDLSGGEPLIHIADVKALAQEAQRLGVGMRLTSNGFWARSVPKAVRMLSGLQAAGVAAVGLSVDEWHLPFVPASVVANYIAACREVGMQALLSAVVRGSPHQARSRIPPAELKNVVARYGLEHEQLVDSDAWSDHRASLQPRARTAFEQASIREFVLLSWQILTSEGRGRHLAPTEEPYGLAPPEPCPAAGELPTIDPEGRLFPCCSPWASRPSHAFGTVSEAGTADDIERMRRSALVRVLHDFGPERLIQFLGAIGIEFPDAHSGICNQCGQLFERLDLAQLEAAAAHVLDLETNGAAYRVLGIEPRIRLPDSLRY